MSILFALIVSTALSLTAQDDFTDWIELLENASREDVVERINRKPDEAGRALDRLLAAFDGSIHSDRRRPEQRRVRYSDNYLEAGLRLADLYEDATGNDRWKNLFQARRLRTEATEQLNDGHFDHALELVRRARTLARDNGDPGFVFSTYLSSSYAYLEQGRPELALDDCETALSLARKLDDDVKLALAYYNLGAAYLHTGRPAEALPYSRQAVEAAQNIGFRLWEANARLNVASAAMAEGSHDEARAHLLAALALAREVDDVLAEGRALYNLGLVAMAEEKWAPARQYLEESLEFIRKVDIRHSHEIDAYNHVEHSALQSLLVCYQHLGIEDRSLVDPIYERLAVLAELRERVGSGHSHDHH